MPSVDNELMKGDNSRRTKKKSFEISQQAVEQ